MASALVDRVASSPTPSLVRRIKKQGNISNVFASFSGGDTTLPTEYARFKREIVHNQDLEAKIVASWKRLLARLECSAKEIDSENDQIIPEVPFSALLTITDDLKDAIRQKGAVIIRNVAHQDAISWETMLRKYVSDNPVTGFPRERPQAFELYWSPSRMAARSHPNVLDAQRWVNLLWNTKSDADYPVDLETPVSYADRARMRNPGDKNFNLGPHSDCGSVELWEHGGYRKCYADIFNGEWEKYDPFDATLRDQTDTNLHDAVAYCGVFRTWQGWLSLSDTSPGEGTLLVLPSLREPTAYMALRPLFKPILPAPNGNNSDPAYLAAANWTLDLDSSSYPGSIIGKTQELSAQTHPHLRPDENMVPMPRVKPGDYVFWHCEGVHAVEPVHLGSHDSSVLYIPACPLTERNAEHLLEQRECLRLGESGPDFPGGEGEGKFAGRGAEDSIVSDDRRRAMGLQPFDPRDGKDKGAWAARERANRILFASE